MNKLTIFFAIVTTAVAGCGISDATLREEGHSGAYVQGFHDGRHSGLREAGNRFEHFVQDRNRFDNDEDYKNGWLAGEVEGQRLQHEATRFGNVAGDIYQGAAISREANKRTDANAIAKDALKNVDTSELGKLKSNTQ